MGHIQMLDHGAVYILENCEARRVKVGITINDVAGRLRSVNDMWLELSSTCQICGERRLVNDRGLVPKHNVSGRGCSGGDALPLERDTTLAESHLKNLKESLDELSGSKKVSVTRIVNGLEKRIERYRSHGQPIGTWQINTVYYTKSIESVESLSHEILADRLDNRMALFGEVFCCSVREATEAVEAALSKLGLYRSARKETQFQAGRELRVTGFEYQEPERKDAKYECGICGSQWKGVEPGINPCPKCETHLYRRLIAYV